MILPNVPRCQHLKVNGTQCGSPALKENKFCYFHYQWRASNISRAKKTKSGAKRAFSFPALEDANAVQLGLMQVMRLLTSGDMDSKTAGLLLYALQTASFNLRQTNFETSAVTSIVVDPRRVDETLLGGDLWCKEDFDEEEDDDEAADTADDEELDDEEDDDEQQVAQADAEDANA